MRHDPRSRRPSGRVPGAGSGPRRDRRGRGMRGQLTPVGLPLHRTRSEVFDDLVLDAVEELEEHWAAELSGVEFAVEDVPPAPASEGYDTDDANAVFDRQVPLGRLFRTGLEGTAGPMIVVYRRPVEARATHSDDRGDLIFMIVAELVAELLGRDIDEIDPPRD